MSDPAGDDDAVRRLLAEARHDEPVPPEVAERLDVVLARLVEAREQEGGAVSLGARRQRRRGLLLLAAAAAVVVGVAVPSVQQLGRPGSGSDDTASSASDTSAERAVSGAEAAGSVAPSEPARQPAELPAEQDGPKDAVPAPAAGDLAAVPPLVVLTSAGFETEVRRAADAPSAPSPLAAGADATRSTRGFLPEGCTGDLGPGELRGASYDGVPAVLAYRPVVAGSAGRRVDLLSCDGSATLLRSTTIPAG